MYKLRQLRKQKDLSMKELGSIIGVSESTISLYERGKHEPDFQTLKKLADYFQTSTDYLLGVTENSQNNDKKTVTKSDGMIALSDEEKEMLKLFRSSPTELQRMTLLALEGHQALRKEKNEQK